jgi:hypothetical protein
MGFSLDLITGVCLGMELFEDEDFNYVSFDILIVRITFFKVKSS